MQIEHIIFLIHPCCYEPLGPDAIRRDNLQLFVDTFREVSDEAHGDPVNQVILCPDRKIGNIYRNDECFLIDNLFRGFL